jgi:hypothetical protein
VPWPDNTPAAFRIEIGKHRTPSTPFDDELFPFIEKRVTNRRRDAVQGLPDEGIRALREIAHASGAILDIVSDRTRIQTLGEIVATGDKLRILNARMHREMMAEVRWTKEEAETGDGLDIATLELTAADVAGLRMLRRPSVVHALREVGGGDGLKKMTRKTFDAASAIALLRFADPDLKRAHLFGGQALQRFWLRANARGIAVHPMTPFFFFLPRDRRIDAIDDAEWIEVRALRRALDEIFPPTQASDIILVRLGIAGPPTARSLRKPPLSILTVE